MIPTGPWSATSTACGFSAAARMQVQDDVHDRLELAADGGAPRQIREPVGVDEPNRFDRDPGHLRRNGGRNPQRMTRADVVLATNMISVGVDVDRLGLMVVMGQPQAAAEYIQATSRVGRQAPRPGGDSVQRGAFSGPLSLRGLHGIPRRPLPQVESTSVTPFSPRARDRGLHAVVIALARLRIDGLRENDQAAAAPDHLAELQELRGLILERAQAVDPDEVAGTAEDLDRIVERWCGLAEEHPGLVYSSSAGTETALLTAAAPELESGGSFPTMWSLRDVDAESNLFFPRKR